MDLAAVRYGRICKPCLKSFITVACSLFGVPLVGDFICLVGRIPSRLGLRLWTQKITNLTALCWLNKTLGNVPTRLTPHSSWTYSAPVNTGLQQQVLAATMPYAAGRRVAMSLEKSLMPFDLPPASCRTKTPLPTRTNCSKQLSFVPYTLAVLDYQSPCVSPDRLSGYGVLPYIAAPRFANIKTVALASGLALALQSARQAIHLLG